MTRAQAKAALSSREKPLARRVAQGLIKLRGTVPVNTLASLIHAGIGVQQVKKLRLPHDVEKALATMRVPMLEAFVAGARSAAASVPSRRK